MIQWLTRQDKICVFSLYLRWRSGDWSDNTIENMNGVEFTLLESASESCDNNSVEDIANDTLSSEVPISPPSFNSDIIVRQLKPRVYNIHTKPSHALAQRAPFPRQNIYQMVDNCNIPELLPD